MEHSTQRDGAEDTGDDADGHYAHALAQNQPNDLARLTTQGQADSDLAKPRANQDEHYAIKTQGCQEEAHPAEASKKNRSEPGLLGRVVEPAIQSFDVDDRLLRI